MMEYLLMPVELKLTFIGIGSTNSVIEYHGNVENGSYFIHNTATYSGTAYGGNEVYRLINSKLKHDI